MYYCVLVHAWTRVYFCVDRSNLLGEKIEMRPLATADEIRVKARQSYMRAIYTYTTRT